MRSGKCCPYLILFTAFAGLSCKKVINLDLKNAAPQIVIQGEVTNLPQRFTVNITQTVDFSAANNFPPVTGADVIITDSTTGVSYNFQEVDSGVYTSVVTPEGVPLHTYNLKVTSHGQVYTASSTMPGAVPLDSVTFAENVNFNGNLETNAVANFQDPPGIANYYQFTEVVDGRPIPDIFVFDDRLSDGRYIQYPLFNDSAYLQKGDNLMVNMYCVDANVYNYFYTLMNVTANANFQTATPANPVSNLTNGALGYFSAHTVQTIQLVVY
jgi:hypothetical protein